MPQDALEESLSRPFGTNSRGGGALRVISYVSIRTAGTGTVTAPPGTSQCLGFARGPGGNSNSAGVHGGGGGAEEPFAASVSTGQALSYVVTAGGSQNPTTVAFQGKPLASAAAGRNATSSVPGAGGAASSAGSPGASAVAGTGTGGNSGGLLSPSAGANVNGDPNAGSPAGQFGAGAGVGGGGGTGIGGAGLLSIIFLGP